MFCLPPELLYRASYMYKECEARVTLSDEKCTAKLDAVGSSCDARMNILRTTLDQQVNLSSSSCSMQLTAVTKQVEATVDILSESYRKRLTAITDVARPSSHWSTHPLLWGGVGLMVGAGTGVLVGVLVERN